MINNGAGPDTSRQLDGAQKVVLALGAVAWTLVVAVLAVWWFLSGIRFLGVADAAQQAAARPWGIAAIVMGLLPGLGALGTLGSRYRAAAFFCRTTVVVELSLVTALIVANGVL